jgi:hypothetical protein
MALRWWRVFPGRRNEDGTPAEPEEHELRMLVADRKVAKERRKRLGSLSWFMRCLLSELHSASPEGRSGPARPG